MGPPARTGPPVNRAAGCSRRALLVGAASVGLGGGARGLASGRAQTLRKHDEMSQETTASVRVEPFAVAVEQEVLDDLGSRLERTRWPDGFRDAGWSLGTDPAYLRDLVGHWRGGFDWRAVERAANGFAHFRADIGGFGVHFVHERGRGPAPLPLLLTHGWPSSFLELLRIVPLLTDPAASGGDPADAFDVVVPSLPGFGFSDRPREPGMDEGRIGRLWARLMTEGLGYDRFGGHGGDIGATVSKRLAAAEPERVVGVHLIQDADWGPAEGAYAFLQATKPQTLAYALNDSPAGLAGWIVEKFRTWSDSGGDVERRFTKDELLATITLYWATETIGSSMRLYAEGGGSWGAPEPTVSVPAGIALVGWSGGPPPEEADGTGFADLRRVTRMARGGHFLAGEEPALLAEELRAFFRPLRRNG